MKDLHEYEDYLVEEEKSQLTRDKYIRDVKTFFIWLAGREITKAETIAYKMWLTERYAVASVNSMLSSLNSYFVFCGKPECRVKTLKVQRDTFCSEDKELTKEEYHRLVNAAKDNPQLSLLMQTICGTGIRVSEHRFITVEALRQGKALVRSKGKIRAIFIPKKLCKRLLAYARGCGIQSGSVFLGRTGKPLDRSRIWAQMKKLCGTAKVLAEKVFPHNLRHLFARMFYSLEKDIIRLADVLGHSSVNTTRIYTQESGDIHRKQIERLQLLFIT